MTGIDHQQGVGNSPATAAVYEGFFGTPEQNQRILATGKKQGRTFKRGGDFPQNKNGFFFQRVQMRVAQM
jgi:hypothetical protein